MTEITTHYRACNLCEAICGIRIQVQGGEIVDLRGDEDDPFSQGHICPKAVALQDIHNDPDRLRQPLRRTATGWQEISWEEALAAAAEGILKVQADHGRDALALYLGNPNVHNYGSLLYGVPLARTLRTKNRFSATSVDQLPHHLVSYWMFGHQLLLPVPDVDRTHFFLIFGANPLASNGSLMTAPGIRKRLKAIQARGGEVVVVDPRRSETARHADQHLFVRPGTDALLLAALVHTVLDEGLAAPGRLAEHTLEAEALAALAQQVAPFAPQRVAAATGVAAGEIRALARRFAAAESAVCYGRMGVSTQDFGAVCQWLINGLNFITGNLDRPGGAMFTHPAVELRAGLTGRGSYGRWRSRVRGLPEFGGELPVAALAEEITTPGEGQVRGLVTAAGNPVLSTPNGTNLEAALGQLDFMVSIDFYLNETTRHAHLILPPTAALEHDHYDLVFNLLAVRNVAKYSAKVFEAGEGTREDWQIYHALERRIYLGRGKTGGGKTTLRGRIERAILGRLGPARLLDLLLRRGPYGAGFRPGKEGLSLKALRRQRHGIDLGALRPALPDALQTRERRIVLLPEALVADLPRLAARLDGAEEGAAERPLVLIGRRQVRGCNSWMHNYPRLMGGSDRCTLLMHPRDARDRGLVGAERVVVTSRVGRVELPLEVSDEIMPGVVSIPHGFGHDREGVRLTVASRHPGASINDLTDETRVDAVSGNAALSGVPVSVTAVVTAPTAAVGAASA